MRTPLLLSLLLVPALVPSVAHADDALGVATGASDGDTHADAELSMVSTTSALPDMFEHLQVAGGVRVTPWLGIDGALAAAAYDAGDDVGIGSLEVGAVAGTTHGHVDLAARIGATVPTATDDSLITAFATLFLRPADLATVANASFVRLSARVTDHLDDRQFVRGELGFDPLIWKGNPGTDVTWIAHGSVAYGYGPAVATATVTTMKSMSSGDTLGSFVLEGRGDVIVKRGALSAYVGATVVHPDDENVFVGLHVGGHLQ